MQVRAFKRYIPLKWYKAFTVYGKANKQRNDDSCSFYKQY